MEESDCQYRVRILQMSRRKTGKRFVTTTKKQDTPEVKKVQNVAFDKIENYFTKNNNYYCKKSVSYYN